MQIGLIKEAKGNAEKVISRSRISYAISRGIEAAFRETFKGHFICLSRGILKVSIGNGLQGGQRVGIGVLVRIVEKVVDFRHGGRDNFNALKRGRV